MIRRDAIHFGKKLDPFGSEIADPQRFMSCI